jgi:RHH-type proline utilization regulon transcriptional repressor/proline dehydrogenase/delta 1-pyrroline-5-carboxylate dehydrogenase
LRVLCLQEESADGILELLKGAMAELVIGDPADPATDIGPVITERACESIRAHIETKRANGHPIHQIGLPASCDPRRFVPPTLIELDHLNQLDQEVFGPVLHVIRFGHHQLEDLMAQINATGYGLTFGIQSRIDETIHKAIDTIQAGNIYVNRSIIGAVVGVQPFGGHGLSGTGPKAGGPLYVRRLLSRMPSLDFSQNPDTVLPGPVGESNRHSLLPRGMILCLAETREELMVQIEAALMTGNRALVASSPFLLSADCQDKVRFITDWTREVFDAILFSGSAEALKGLQIRVAERPGPIVGIHVRPGENQGYTLDGLLKEQVVCDNIAASGGNPTLMNIG